MAIPDSPSWRSRLLRSPGHARITAPATRIAAHRSRDTDDIGQPQHPALGSFSRLLLQSNNSSHHQGPTPFLTLALLKLQDLLPEFCQALASHQPAHACALLEASVATSSSSRHNSPHPSPQQPSSSPSTNVATPLLQYWFHNNSHQHHQNQNTPSSSALALEGEWDKYVEPLLLLAGAEVLYENLQHLEQPQAMQLLYQRVAGDLEWVQQVLCEPLLPTTQTTTTTTHRVLSQEAAIHVTNALQTLISICNTRMQLMHLQQQVVLRKEHWAQVATGLDGLVQPTSAASNVESSSSSSSAAEPLSQRLWTELKNWTYALGTAVALSQCQFLETMVGLQQWKQLLPTTTTQDTRIAKWIHAMFVQTLSLLPLYFDRVHAFAGPLYGFDATRLMAHTSVATDWNAEILDFLRRQDKSSGPHLIVAMVIDASRTNNLHVERGFQWNRDKLPQDEHNVRMRYPAVYLRSTMLLHHHHQSNRPTLSVSQSSNNSSGKLNTSQSNLLPGWSKTSLTTSVTSSSSSKSPIATKTKAFPLASASVLEYGPDSGNATSWPHCDWDQLLAVLIDSPLPLVPRQQHQQQRSPSYLLVADQESTDDEALVVTTYRDKNDEREGKTWSDSIKSIEEAAGIFGSSRDSISGVDISHAEPPRTTSQFHIVSLGDSMNLVAMVKGEEGQRWHRRRSSLTEADIRSFLASMAAKIRVSSIFGKDGLPPTVQESMQLSLDGFEPPKGVNNDAPPVWSDENVQKLLGQIKTAFGLRPVQQHDSLRTHSSSPNPRRGIVTPRYSLIQEPNHHHHRLRYRRHAKVEPMDQSAASLFLGSDLARLVK